jgi:hypothetical protein
MRVSISDKIRKLAALIELDNTPYNESIGGHKMLDEDCKERPSIRKKRVVEEPTEISPTAPPQQRRPREQPGHLNKWNEDTKTGLMKEYMQEYRADGKDKEVDGPKSTYKKKLKV